MKNNVKVLFLDVGGVLMTNGWDHRLRGLVAEKFTIELDEMTERHGLFFDLFERGGLSFDEYLQNIIFYKKRDCTLEEVKRYIFDAVKLYPDMVEYIKEIKKEHNLKIVVISNEGRELILDRIQRFDLRSFVDFFLISSFVHLRKPDHAFYRLAIDIVQYELSEMLYIDDRELLIKCAAEVGLRGIWHQNIESTKHAMRLAL